MLSLMFANKIKKNIYMNDIQMNISFKIQYIPRSSRSIIKNFTSLLRNLTIAVNKTPFLQATRTKTCDRNND